MLYLIGPYERGPLKIGKANEPDKRCREIQHYSPLAVRVFASGILSVDHIPWDIDEREMGSLYLQMEGLLHKIFCEKHSHGEWYNLSTDDVMSGILEFDDNKFITGSRLYQKCGRDKGRPFWTFRHAYPWDSQLSGRVSKRPDVFPSSRDSGPVYCDRVKFYPADIDWTFHTVEPIANEKEQA